jgi:distribution and morphology protein 10
MLDFMDYVQTAFYRKSRWNPDNSYASLTSTSVNLLDFAIPSGVRLHVSSLSAPNFATSYTLGTRGVVDGSLSFLYSSLGLSVVSRSSDVPLSRLVRGYRHLEELQSLQKKEDGGHDPATGRDALLYGRLYLPGSTLEALYLRRLSPTRLLTLNCVSDAALPNGGTVLATLRNDHGKYTTEYLYSTDSSLLGMRALYNFGLDPRDDPPSGAPSSPTPRTPAHPWDHQSGRLSAGAEAYVSPVNKSGGVSTGIRFATLPTHPGFPYTLALTVNPLMGNLSSTYAVQAGPNVALCSRFDFNVYSYESDVVVGVELWRRERAAEEVRWVARMLRAGWKRADEDVTGVLKARMDNHGTLGVLWECRVKELLVGVGAGVDLKNKERMIGRVGVEISYSS